MWYTHGMDDSAHSVLVQEHDPTLFGPQLAIEGVPVMDNSHEIVAILPEKNILEEPALPPLSLDEDSFALAVIEYSGNIAAAYQSVFGTVKSPTARGQALLVLPQVQHRIAELSNTIKEVTLISLGSHLQELAQIRDLAKMQGQLKVALQAERTRGEITGLYEHLGQNAHNKNAPTNIQINMVSRYDTTI